MSLVVMLGIHYAGSRALTKQLIDVYENTHASKYRGHGSTP